MKKEEIMKSVSTTFGKVSVKLKKHSPEILVVAGVVVLLQAPLWLVMQLLSWTAY